ncbi:MAG TPA: hypothetical protein VM345_12935 [Acidimicrobiales bacterium]|nr:hypothetical protein [Acidimicrobiales bacterium]
MPGPDALPDGPDADILEQHREVVPDEGGEIDSASVSRDPEAPEADVLEQAQSVPLPPDDELS